MKDYGPSECGLGGQRVEEQIAGVEDGGLAVGQEGRSAELIGIPERDVAIAHRFPGKLPPWVELADRIISKRIPDRNGTGVRFRPGCEVAEQLGGDERLPGEYHAPHEETREDG